MIKTIARFILRKEIAECQRRMDIAAQAVADPRTTGIQIGEGTLDIGLTGGGAQLLAGMFIGALNDDRCTNFLEVTFDSMEHGRIVVNVQKAKGKTPATLVREAEAKLREMERDAARGRWVVRHAGWLRNDDERDRFDYMTIPVPKGTDLSCVAFCEDAIDVAMKSQQ